MTMTKKKVFVASLAICLVAIISMGTLAWFTAEDRLENQFTILDSLENFQVDVWEIVDADGDGVEETIGKGVVGPNGTTYEQVLPGNTYKKAVFVENNSDNLLADQYIKMEVTFTNYAALRTMAVDLADYPAGAALPEFDCTTMLEGACFTVDENDDAAWWYDQRATSYRDNTVTYVFYLKKILKDTDGEECLFRGVTIPATMDINDAQYLIDTNGFQINVVAYAIQSANIKDPAGNSVLEHARYAFNEAWDDKDEPLATDLYPTNTTTTAPRYE